MRVPARSLLLDQQAALRAVLEAILQQLGEEGARATGATVPDETFGQSASEEGLAVSRDPRIAGDHTNCNRIPSRTFLPEVQ